MSKKIITAAGAITLTATGIAAASSPPEAADKGLSTAEEQVGVELPATKDTHPGAQDAQDSEAPETEDAGQGPVDNHGAEVSAVAQTEFPTGREHGEAVSAVARDNHGAEARAANAAPQASLGADNAGEHGKP